MAKTATFGVLHVGTSFVVTYGITGSYAMAGVVTVVEPLVNTVMHYFFDEYWDHPKAVAARAAMAGWVPGQATRMAGHGHAHHFSTKARSIT
jgi:uncharacterized membrane protein